MKTMLILLMLAAAGFGQKLDNLPKNNFYVQTPRDPNAAALLSVFLPGMGNLYGNDWLAAAGFFSMEMYLWYRLDKEDRVFENQATWHDVRNYQGQITCVCLMAANRFISAAMAHHHVKKVNKRWQITFNLLIEP